MIFLLPLLVFYFALGLFIGLYIGHRYGRKSGRAPKS